jgi:plasmid stabilization system protein ParE
MAARKVIWSQNATEQLNEILNYYLQRNGNNVYGSKLYKKIIGAARILSKQSLIGKKTEHENIRVMAIGFYLMFYELTEKQIEILIVWDGRRNPKQLINLLKD